MSDGVLDYGRVRGSGAGQSGPRRLRRTPPLLATVDSAVLLQTRERSGDDWYREPGWAVEGLLDVEEFPSPCWDPACGLGRIPEVLQAAGVTCFGTDLRTRSDLLRARPWWRGEHDFAAGGAAARVPLSWQSIVTNPPFALAEEFLRRALAMAQHKVAFLLRLSWIEGRGRRWVWDETPLAAIHPFARRVSMPPGDFLGEAKGGAVAFAWFVWERGRQRVGGRYLPPVVTRIERGPR